MAINNLDGNDYGGRLDEIYTLEDNDHDDRE